ncbi:MAG: DUF2723 domain-containing protein [Candidatus Omnitrophota bacterium]
MSKNNKTLIITSMVLFTAVITLYLSNLCPTISWGDSAEFITTAYTLGIPHPPGYPLYTLLGKLFTFLPVNSIAYRLNFMSAFFAALTCIFLFLISFQLTKNYFISILSTLTFATITAFWQYATVAEIYTLQSFFISLLIYYSIICLKSQNVKYLFFLSLVYGLLFSVHTSNILLLPVPLYVAFKKNKEIKLSIISKVIMLLMFLLGISFYLYLPISASFNPLINWGNPNTFARFLRHITGKNFHYQMSSLSWLLLSRNLSLYLTCILQQFNIFMIIFILAGIVHGFSANKKAAVILLIIFISNSLFFLKQYQFFSHFLIPSYLTGSIFLGLGLYRAFITLKAKYFKITLIIVLILFVFGRVCLNYHQMDKKEYRTVYSLGEGILNSISNPAVIFPGADTQLLFLFWYFKYVEKRYPQIIIIDKNLNDNSYLKRLKQKYPKIKFSKEFYDIIAQAHQENQVIAKMIEDNTKSFDFYFTDLTYVSAATVTPQGHLYKYKKSPDAPELLSRNIPDYAFYFKDPEYKKYIAIKYNNRAIYYLKNNKIDQAIQEIKNALYVNPDSYTAYFNLGGIFFQKGMLKRAVSNYKKAIFLNKTFAPAYFALGECLYFQAKYHAAIKQYKNALSAQPSKTRGQDFIKIYYALSRTYSTLGNKNKSEYYRQKALNLAY